MKLYKIKNKFRKYISKKLFEKGFEFKKFTEQENLVNFINKLHPIKIQHDLIRIGPKGDGGYLVPNDLEGIYACFSPGVDNISEFELECINRGMKVFMADKSVDMPNLSISKSQYGFIKKHIGISDNENFITMDTWVNNSLDNKNSELLLQMDIEGCEYHTILNISHSLMMRFRIIVLEFHCLQKMWNPETFDLFSTAFNKILETHICVHIHPNNYSGNITREGISIPQYAEFTFIRKDRAEAIGYQDDFPHPLDFDNTDNPSLPLAQNWYRKNTG